MANNYDIEMWEKSKEKARKNGLTLKGYGEDVRVFDDNMLSLGVINGIRELWNFLCGFEAGLSKGRGDDKR